MSIFEQTKIFPFVGLDSSYSVQSLGTREGGQKSPGSDWAPVGTVGQGLGPPRVHYGVVGGALLERLWGAATGGRNLGNDQPTEIRSK